MTNLLISGGRLLDPLNHRDGVYDLLLKGGRVASVAKKIRPGKKTAVLDARGQWVFPGLVDVHVHFREPGGEESETIESGSRAAAAGGVTSVLAMANTRPVIDSPAQVRFVLRRARESAVVRVYPVGAVTRGLEGRELTDIFELAKAGCKAFSDDGHCVMDSRLMRWALEHTKNYGVPLVDHCEDENLSFQGVMHEGDLSERLGLRGIPAESEAIMVARNIYLAQLTGAHVHCAHMSTKDAIDLIRWAKKKGIPVTAETCPHYFSLTEASVERCGTHAKMKPPLRRAQDRAAILEGLKDGTIDVIATDHAPHNPRSKAREFSQAPFGIIGLETSFALVCRELILKKILSPLEAVEKMSLAPARLFSVPGGDLSEGSPADVAVFDPQKTWTLDARMLQSKSRNSPFLGQTFPGKVTATLVAGRVVYRYAD